MTKAAQYEGMNKSTQIVFFHAIMFARNSTDEVREHLRHLLQFPDGEIVTAVVLDVKALESECVDLRDSTAGQSNSDRGGGMSTW